MPILMPNGKQSFQTNAGLPLVGGKVYTYAAGTNTLQATYSDAAGAAPNTNPVILNARGEATIFWNGNYKVTLRDALDNLIWTQDNITTIDPLASILTAYIALLTSSAGAANVGFIQSGAGAVARTLQDKGRDIVNAADFGVAADGTDMGAKLATAIAAANGRYLMLPPGVIVISTPINLLLDPGSEVFAKGPKLIGAGVDSTIFDNRVTGAPMISVDSNANHATTFKGVYGSLFEDFSIKNLTGGQTGQTAIYLRTNYAASLRRLRIQGMIGSGIRIPCLVGDNDASNLVQFDQIRIDDCTGWGIDVGDPGHNENSLFSFEQVFVQNCGTAAATSVPASGGLKLVGQIFAMRDSAFTINQECGMWVPGQGGLATNFTLDNVTFENNFKRHFFTRGIQGLRANNCQMYNNDSHIAMTGFEVEAGTFSATDIRVKGMRVRATSGNNGLTAFKFSGANLDRDSCGIEDTVWVDFDYAGQVRYAGVPWPQIDQDCAITVDATTITLKPVGKGNRSPLRLAGPKNASGTGVRSVAGEWISHFVPSQGIAYTASGLANSTRHYAYLYEDMGIVKIDVSTTGPVIDVDTGVDSPGYGYFIKSGDATRLFIGSAITDGAGNFATTATGWLNPTPVSGQQVGVPSYLWVDGSGKLRVRVGVVPTSDTDGVIVGTQT